MSNHSDRPNIALVIVTEFEHFRSDIVWRTNLFCENVVVKPASRLEVNDLDLVDALGVLD